MSEGRSRARDVIGWFGAAAAATIVPSAVGVYTGSFETVAGFAAEHPGEAALWSAGFLGLGLLIGLMVRSAIATRQLREKEAAMEALESVTNKQVSRMIVEGIRVFGESFFEARRTIDDPDSVIRDRIESRELDPHSVRVLELALKTGFAERRWLRDALDRGSVVIDATDLEAYDVGHYFRDLAEERGEAVDPYGRPAARFALKPDVADVLAANREVFKAVEDEDAATAEFLRDYKERTARGEARKAEEGARP